MTSGFLSWLGVSPKQIKQEVNTEHHNDFVAAPSENREEDGDRLVEKLEAFEPIQRQTRIVFGVAATFFGATFFLSGLAKRSSYVGDAMNFDIRVNDVLPGFLLCALGLLSLWSTRRRKQNSKD